MRRYSPAFLLIVALLFLLGAVGCGSASQSPGEGAAPEDVLKAALDVSDTMTSSTGGFDIALSFDADESQLSEQEAAMLADPMRISGTFAVGSDPQAVECTVSLDMMGETLDMGFKVLDKAMWLNLLDQWYETPPDMQDVLAQNTGMETQMAEIEKLISDLGVDPVTWMKDLRLVGEEEISGTAVYHLAGTPDVAKMMTDVIGLMQSEEFLNLIDPTGSLTGEGMGMDMIPSPDELQEMQTQIAAMFEDFTVELWTEKATSMLRKLVVVAHMTPPPGEDADGMNAIDLIATVTLDNLNQPVMVEAPVSALPYSELEKAMQENPDMFLGPLGGVMGGMQTY
jgi:hypothetical protein